MSAGDVNGDGYADLLLLGEATLAETATLYLGGPNGIDPSARPVAWPYAQLNNVLQILADAAGDVNGDGYADLVVDLVGSGTSSSIGVAYGTATGAPSTMSPVVAPTGTGDAAAGSGFGAFVAGAGDVNGDGFGDLIVGSARSAFLYFGGAAGPSGTPTTLGGAASGACAADVNGDGLADVVLGPMTGEYVAAVYLGTGTGVLGSPILLPGGDGGGSSAVGCVGDVNGDGFGDLIVETGNVSYLYAGGASGPSAMSVTLSAPASTWRIAGAGDLNGDTYDDVLWPNNHASPSSSELDDYANVLLGGTGSGLLSPGPQFLVPAGTGLKLTWFE